MLQKVLAWQSECMKTQVKRVLIVEDEPDMVELLVMHAELRGYETLVATTSDEAERMLNKSPTLIILDLKLDKGHGFDVLAKVKNSITTQHIHVVVFSAQDDMRSINLAYELGADQFVEKPASIKEVFSHAS